MIITHTCTVDTNLVQPRLMLEFEGILIELLFKFCFVLFLNISTMHCFAAVMLKIKRLSAIMILFCKHVYRCFN